jgi:formylglycine-generating enzyme required for sulfatase activity
MGSNPSHFSACGAECPVEKVSWCEAVVFANKLSALEGLAAAYTLPAGFVVGLSNDRCNALAPAVRWNARASGYRLPTEAEWEIAARAGEVGPYAGGELDAVGWYDGNSGSTTHPVGRKQANAWALYDMTGNVWEWAWDLYGDYTGAATDPVGAASGAFRVLRGGGWNVGPRLARVAYRSSLDPAYRYGSLGFRLSRTVP